MTKTKRIKLRKDLTPEQLELVKSYGIKPHSTIYTTVKHCSQSGMTRAIEAYQIKDGDIGRLSYLIVKLDVAKFNKKHGGVTVHGCGMDMGFDLVYRLSYALYGNGYALKQSWL